MCFIVFCTAQCARSDDDFKALKIIIQTETDFQLFLLLFSFTLLCTFFFFNLSKLFILTMLKNKLCTCLYKTTCKSSYAMEMLINKNVNLRRILFYNCVIFTKILITHYMHIHMYIPPQKKTSCNTLVFRTTSLN